LLGNCGSPAELLLHAHVLYSLYMLITWTVALVGSIRLPQRSRE
jgi:hypothetical protein